MLLIIALLLSWPGDVTKPGQEPPLKPTKGTAIEGLYRISGTVDGDDKPYSGVVVILKIDGSQSWYFLYTVGISQFSGVGIKDGSKVSVAWHMEGKSGQKINGVTVYEVGEEGMAGRYTTIPLSSGKEFLKRIPD